MKREAKLIECMSTKAIVFTVITVMVIAGFLLNANVVNVNAMEYQREKRDVNELILDLESNNFEYTGESIQPYPSVKDSSGMTSALKDIDFSVSYGSNIEPGKGTITITGLGSKGTGSYEWYGTKTFEFTIDKAVNPLENTDCSLNENYEDDEVDWKKGYGYTGINFYYHDGFKICKNLKNEIISRYDNYNLPNNSNLIGIIKSSDLKFTSSNKNIFKVNKNKNSITATGVGIAYLNFTIPESSHYKEFKGRIRIISWPPSCNYVKYSKKLEKGNKFRYGVTYGKNTEKSKTSFKCKVIIAKSKKFTKSSIIKSYTLSNKAFSKQKITTIKSKKLKKNMTFYIKTYTYKKLSNGKTLYSGAYIYRYKVSKNGKITSKFIFNEERPHIK